MKGIYTMVGMKFRGTEKAVASLKSGDVLTLVREKTNPHDPNAVAVWRDGIHLAYVKGTEARGLARSMDSGGFSQIIGAFRITGDRWPQVEVDNR